MSTKPMQVNEATPAYLARAAADDVPPGYKRTEVGVIPEDWDCLTVGDIAKVKGGKRLPAGYELVDTATPYPYVRVSDMYPGGVDTSAIKYVPEQAFPAIQNYRIYHTDIFISVAGTLGIVGVVPQELSGANLTENADRITDIQCNRDYLKYWLMSQPIQQVIESIRTVGAQPKLALGRIAKFDIALPKYPAEQRAIAEALSDVDELLAALDKLIAKKRAIKQDAMQQLLTGKTRLPGFSGEWETKRLWEIADLHRENIVPAHSSDKLFTHFSLPAFDEGRSPAIEPGASIGSNKFKVPANAILVSKLNPRIPRVWLPDDGATNAVASTEFLVLTPKQKMSRQFLYNVCSSPKFCDQLELSATGTTGSHQRITPSDALIITVRVPVDTEEQTAIATVLADMDSEIAALEARRDKTRQIKQGMMQQLLTGRVRLVKPQAEEVRA